MRSISVLAAAILVADQITKWWALHGLRFGEAVPVIPGFFSLTLVMNPGLAFGMLAGVPETFRWMVGLLSIGAVVILAVIAARLLPTGGPWTRLALGLIFGGAAGNLIDRLRFGAVGGLPRLLLGRLSLAGLQRGGLRHHRRRDHPRLPHAGGLAEELIRGRPGVDA
jgi:signal peptidase II